MKSGKLALLALLFTTFTANASEPFDVDPALDNLNSTESFELWDATAAAPSRVQLVHVTGDALDKGTYYDLQVEADNSGAITKLIFMANGASIQEYTLDQIKSGIVLVRQSGKDVISVSAPDFDPYSGGQVKLRYLHNGIKDTYNDFMMHFFKDGNVFTVFDINNGKRNQFRNAYLKKKTFLGKIIGIDEIIPSL